MLVEADLMIVRVALAGNCTRLPVHLLVMVDQILEHQMKALNGMLQMLCLCSVLVMESLMQAARFPSAHTPRSKCYLMEYWKYKNKCL